MQSSHILESEFDIQFSSRGNVPICCLDKVVFTIIKHFCSRRKQVLEFKYAKTLH